MQHTRLWELLMFACCKFLRLPPQHKCWIICQSVFQALIHVISATSVARGPDTPLPSCYHQLLGGKSQSSPRPSEKYNLPLCHRSSPRWTWPKHLRERRPGGTLTRSPELAQKAPLHVLSFSRMSEHLTLFLRLSLSQWLLPQRSWW